MKYDTAFYNHGAKNAARAAWVAAAMGNLRAHNIQMEDASVLYLPSVEDLERPLYLAAGIREQNLYGFEIDRCHARQLLSEGKHIFSGDIIEALPYAEFFIKPDLIYADFNRCFDGLYTIPYFEAMLAVPTMLHRALWGLGLFRDRGHNNERDPETERAFAFLEARARVRIERVWYCTYKSEHHGRTYTLDQALFRVRALS